MTLQNTNPRIPGSSRTIGLSKRGTSSSSLICSHHTCARRQRCCAAVDLCMYRSTTAAREVYRTSQAHAHPDFASTASNVSTPSPIASSNAHNFALSTLAGTPFTLRDCLCWFCPSLKWEQEDGAAAETSLQPKVENAGQPQQGQGGGGGGEPAVAAQPSVEGGDVGVGTEQAVGSEEGGARREGAATGTAAVEAGGMASGVRALSLPRVTVQGVDVPLDEPIVQLWAALRHPDHFLYIVVRKQG